MVFFIYSINNSNQQAIQLISNNIDEILANNDLVFVNFYANWCRFSQMLQPLYDELAIKYKEANPNAKVAIVKVDCDAEPNIAAKYHINKYPTLKLIRYGVATKREYRGARSVEAFQNYLNEQLADPVNKLNSVYHINEFDFVKKPSVVGYFEKEDSDNYKTFFKVANLLRENCNFIAGFGDVATPQRTNGDKIVYRTVKGGIPEDTQYNEELTNQELLYSWSNDRCIKVVREITFENAEELTEEGLPFLILFHKPEDMSSVMTFEREVMRQLVHERSSINAVYADGTKFTHPLHHLGKSLQDLPVLAIDSFRHMYLYPDFNQISNGNNLNQFVQDLHSGKLHREFHNGPDPTQAPRIEAQSDLSGADSIHLPKSSDEPAHQHQQGGSPDSPPDSMFNKLKPSNQRYTKLKDEF